MSIAVSIHHQLRRCQDLIDIISAAANYLSSSVHSEELEQITDETKRLRRLIELNVINSAENLVHSTIIQNAWKRGQKLSIHAWAYDLSDG